jgi:hypothetical protein
MQRGALHDPSVSPQGLEDPNEDEIVRSLMEHRGHPSPTFKKELSDIRWMHQQGYTNAQIMSCLKAMEADKWWKDKEVLMRHVREQIGKFVKGSGVLDPGKAWAEELRKHGKL